MNKKNSTLDIIRAHVLHAVLIVAFILLPSVSAAATLRLSPDTGVYTAGSTFTAQVLVNTQSKPINAADAQLTFNPREITVVSVNRSSSVFNLWTLEPTFSNSAGTISFGGGSPTGYTGSNGNIITITFRTIAAGTPKVNFKSGSILAADGMGTNVLTAMNGGSYTVEAQSTTPPPEYVPPPDTPEAPNVTSDTHPNEDTWYKTNTANVRWRIPDDVVALRTLLDEYPSSVPTILYEEPITSRGLAELPQGTSYFHIQFRNADGWGRVTHYALNVDSEPPSEFAVSEAETDTTKPTRTLLFTIKDVSPILKYTIQIDGGEPIEFKDTENTKKYELPTLPPGRHTVVVEAFDSAGNSRAATYSFDVASFESPVFTDYPERLGSGVIPAIRGTTRPHADVTIVVREGDIEYGTYTARGNDTGVFTFIPEKALPVGVYTLSASARDQYGAQSEPSEVIRIIVEESGYIAVGSFVVKVLSVIVPLIALIFFLVFGSWYLIHRMRVWRKKILKESREVESVLESEFATILTNLHRNVTELKETRKTKLTKAETALIEQIESDLQHAQNRLRKEITDIEDIVE